MLVTLQIPPGVYKNGTEYQSKGRWQDCDLIRWFEGTLRPVGGWRKIIGGTPRSELQVLGTARGSFAWRDNGKERYLAIGTEQKLYARRGTVSELTDITPAGLVVGFQNSGANTGYGGGPYGFDTYGTPRTTADLSQIATTWSFDNFGQLLVAVQSEDGRLFTWNLDVLADATEVIATAGVVPLNNKGVIVTDERFVVLLQADGNRRRVTWGDQESLTDWQQTSIKQAGSFELQTNGEIMSAKRVRGQVLILTSTDAHTMQYIGPPLVYGFERVGTGCGCISRNALVAIDKAAMWMGENSFFLYDGFVKPVPCDVSDYVFSRLNRAQIAKIWAVHNTDFGEVTFFYPAGTEVDSYVTYNYRENHWSVGAMARTTGVNDDVYVNPIRVKPDGFLYEHEVGFAYEGQVPFAESGPVELGQGDQVYMCKYMYPDEKTQGDVQARFATRFYPNAIEYNFGPYQMANPTSIRFTGRQVAMRVEGVNAVDWRVGLPRIDVEPGGLR